MYGNVFRKIITDSPEAWELAGIAKRMSFSIDNTKLPIMNLRTMTSDGGSVNVFRHGNTEIWDLKSAPAGDTMFFESADNVICMLSVHKYNGKYRAMVDRTVHLRGTGEVLYVASPYVYVLDSTSDPLTVSAYTLRDRKFIASTVLEYTGGSPVAAMATLVVDSGGFVVVSFDPYASGYKWSYSSETGWIQTSTVLNSYNVYLTRYNFTKGEFVRVGEVSVPDDLKTLYPLPGVGESGWYADGTLKFLTNNGGSRFAVAIRGPMSVGSDVNSWPEPVPYPPVFRWHVAYVYNAKTLELVEELSGQECADTQGMQNFDGLYQEVESGDVLADVIWDAHEYSDDNFEVYQYSLATGVRTVVFSVVAGDVDPYDASSRKFFLDKKGLFIPYEITSNNRQLLRLNFDDTAGAVRDETGDITLMEYEKRGIPVDFDCFKFTIAKNHRQAPAKPYPWA